VFSFYCEVTMKKVIKEKKRIQPIQMTEEEFRNLILQHSTGMIISESLQIPEEVNKNKRLLLNVIDRYNENSSTT
jgi:hypothetical protein